MLLGSVWVGDVIAALTASRAGRDTALAIRAALPEAPSAAGLSVHAGRPRARPRDRRPDATYAPLDVWRAGDATWFATRDVGRGLVTGHHLRVLAVPGAAEKFVRFAFPYAVGPWLAPHGRLAIHAGSIAAGGVGILVLGRSGAGKSTFVVGAIEAGAQALADDTSFLLPDGRLAGLARPLSAAPEAIPQRLHQNLRPLEDVRRRVELDVPRRTGGVVHAGTVLVEHGTAPGSELVPVGAPDVAREIALSSYLVADPRFRAAFLAQASVAARPPAWRMRLGTDPASRPGTIARLLTNFR